MDKLTQFKRGDRVLLTCAGNAGYGTLQLVSPNQKVLLVELEDGLRTPIGLATMAIGLFMNEDGEYYDLISDSVVKVEHPTY